jgi:drug/metabolite transporter (DMT)-like permease
VTGFAGLCLLTILKENIDFSNFGYALLVVSGTVSYGINVNIVSHYLKTLNPLHTATVSLSFMAVPAGLVLWAHGFFQLDFSDTVVQWSIFNTLLLGLVGSSFATVLFYVLVQKAGGIFASLVTYGIPFVALFWGFTNGEAVTLVDLLCLPLILTGVYLANRPNKKIAENNAPRGVVASKVEAKQT